MKIDVSSLQYYLIPGEHCDPSYNAVYLETYRMWREVWSQTLLELDGQGTLHSDDFTRQTHIGALFHGAECAAMTVFHEVDFDLPTARHDSYFRSWPDEAIQGLVRDSKKVLVCSHLTVAPQYRGEVVPGMTLKVLISQMSVQRLLATDCSVMTGTMRCNKGAHTAAYTAGATPILTDQQLHGVSVDLVGFFRSTILQDADPKTMMWPRSLWNNRIEIPRREKTASAKRDGKRSA